MVSLTHGLNITCRACHDCFHIDFIVVSLRRLQIDRCRHKHFYRARDDSKLANRRNTVLECGQIDGAPKRLMQASGRRETKISTPPARVMTRHGRMYNAIQQWTVLRSGSSCSGRQHYGEETSKRKDDVETEFEPINIMRTPACASSPGGHYCTTV